MKRIFFLSLCFSPLEAMHGSERGYVEAGKRYFLKHLNFLDADLAGIGDESERKKTTNILKKYMEQLEKGTIEPIVEKQAEERFPKIVDACKRLTISCILFNQQVEDETLLNIEQDIPEMRLTLAKIDLLEKLHSAIPEGMFAIMRKHKEKTAGNITHLAGKQKERLSKEPEDSAGEGGK